MKPHLAAPQTTPPQQPQTPSAFEARHAAHILGRLVCFDRLLIFGTMQVLHNPHALYGMLQDAGWGAFDLKLFCQPLTEALRAHAEALAKRHGLPIQFIADSKQRKEDLLRGEGHIAGWTHRRLRAVLGGQYSSGQVSRMLRRLREHGLIRRIGRSFTYYLTALANKALVAALKLREHLLLPLLNAPEAA